MQETVTIPLKAQERDVHDYQYLYDEAIQQLQTYAGKVWTDYNIHDPGVTILENLVYAITELGYRGSNKVTDILSDPYHPDLGSNHRADTFFLPQDILTAAPLTNNDYRKLLLEIPGVRNARIFPSTTMVGFKGVYDVDIALEKSPTHDFDTLEATVLPEVRKVLNRNRNLCESFDKIQCLAETKIRFDIELEVAFDVDLPEILSIIAWKLNEFLSPNISFHSLDEMLRKGHAVEAIFNGPEPQEGFVDRQELEEHQIRTEIHTSDILNFIMDIEGVKYLRKLKGYDESGKGFRWFYRVEGDKVPVLDLKNTRVTFYNKNSLIDKGIELVRYQDRILKHRSLTANYKEIRFKAQAGKFQPLEQYFDLQSEFPEAYGIGPMGVRELGMNQLEANQRKGRARQLKGYLMIYEQLLANHFSQLANVKQLFSIDTIDRTYFFQHLLELPGVEYLYRPFIDYYLSDHLRLSAQKHEQSEKDQHVREVWKDFLHQHHQWVHDDAPVREWLSRLSNEGEEAPIAQVERWATSQFEKDWGRQFQDLEMQWLRDEMATKYCAVKSGNGSLNEFNGDQLMYLRFHLIYTSVAAYLELQVKERKRWRNRLRLWQVAQDGEVLGRVTEWAEKQRNTKAWKRYMKEYDPKDRDRYHRRVEQWMEEEAGREITTFNKAQLDWAEFALKYERVEFFLALLDKDYEQWEGYAQGWEVALRDENFAKAQYGPVEGWIKHNANGPEWRENVESAENQTDRGIEANRWFDYRRGDSVWLRFDANQRAYGQLLLRYKSLANYQQRMRYIEDFHQNLDEAVEDEKTFLDRRNRVLDHLLARFGIDIAEFSYAVGKTGNGAKEIQIKQQLLREFPTISKQRGLGMNMLEGLHEVDNCSQLEDRLYKVLGMHRNSRQFVLEGMEALMGWTPQETSAEGTAFELQLNAPNMDWAMRKMFLHGMDKSKYEPSLKGAVLNDDKNRELAKLALVDGAIISSVELVDAFHEKLGALNAAFEGMYLLEHQWLQPFATDKAFTFNVKDGGGNILFESNKSYTMEERSKLTRALMETGIYTHNYEVLELGIDQYKIRLNNEKAGINLDSRLFFASHEEAMAKLDEFQKFFYRCYEEGVVRGNDISRRFTKIAERDFTAKERIAQFTERLLLLGVDQYNYRIRREGADSYRIVLIDEEGQELFTTFDTWSSSHEAKHGISDMMSKILLYSVLHNIELSFSGIQNVEMPFTLLDAWGTWSGIEGEALDLDSINYLLKQLMTNGKNADHYAIVPHQGTFEFAVLNAGGQAIFESRKAFASLSEAEEGRDQFMVHLEYLKKRPLLDANKPIAAFRPITKEMLANEGRLTIELFRQGIDSRNYTVHFDEDKKCYRLHLHKGHQVYASLKGYATEEVALAETRHFSELLERRYEDNLMENSELVHFHALNDHLYPGKSNPFSYITTIVLPDWPTRFQDQRFRMHLQSLVYREVPAHIAVNLRWLSYSKMVEYEQLWGQFLAVKARLNEEPKSEEARARYQEIVGQLMKLVTD